MDFAVTGLAALAAGALNAIAGGGSFLTFPALVWTGVPVVAANATSAMAVSPGYLGGALGFRAELGAMSRARLLREAALSATGGMLGASLLLVTPERLFAGLVPWLLLFATLLFALGGRLNAALAGYRIQSWRGPGLFLVAVYGGYFNGGLGILLMALYALTGESVLNRVNALKNLNSLVLSLLSVAAFVVAGSVVWTHGLWMMFWATLGGFWGARLARRLPLAWVRAGVVVTGLAMSGLFFLR